MRNMDTEKLLIALSRAKNLEKFLNENTESFHQIQLPDYLSQLIRDKGLNRGEIIRCCGLSEVYAYQIFNGTRMPSRDKLLCLLVAAKLTVGEVQKLLKVCGYAGLYIRNEKDCIILYALENNLSVVDLNLNLERAGLPLLTD